MHNEPKNFKEIQYFTRVFILLAILLANLAALHFLMINIEITTIVAGTKTPIATYTPIVSDRSGSSTAIIKEQYDLFES